MKKIISVILLLAVSFLGHTAGMAKAQESKIYLGDNRGHNNYPGYVTYNINQKNDKITDYAGTLRAYIEKTDNGYMTIRILGKNKVQISYFSKDYRYISGMTIDGELSIWGGFYAGTENYYLVWGQENQKESDSREVVRVVKYDKQWRRQGAASLCGANTVVPFKFGSLRMAEHNGYLYIRTAHEMYRTDDGLRHQANMTIKVREEDMKILDTAHSISDSFYGYVAHSFNEFIMTDDRNNVIALDHGDGYPRAAMLCTSHIEDEAKNHYSGYKAVSTIGYHGEAGDNHTGATIGGLEYSSSNYLTAGTSVTQDENSSYKRIYNVYITITDRNDFSQKNTVFKQITEYPDMGEVSATNPYLVKVSPDKFLLVWSEQKLEDDIFSTTTDILHYVYIDGEGNFRSDIYTDHGYLSDCTPIAVNGNIIWYAMDNESVVFYKIDSKGKLTTGKGQFPDHIDIYPKSILGCRMIFTKIGGNMTYEEAEKSYIIMIDGKVVDKENYLLSNFLAAFEPDNSLKSISVSCCSGINEYYKGETLFAYPISKKPVLEYVIEDGGIRMEWEQERGALGYLIEREDERGNIVKTEINDYTVTSWTDRNVERGVEYQYSIKAFTTDGTKKIYSDSSLKKKIALNISGDLPSNKSKDNPKTERTGNREQQSAIIQKGVVKKGEKYSDNAYTYKIIKGAKKGKKAQVSIVKYRGREKSLYLEKKYVILNKVKCRIVDIGKRAFYKNNRLKRVMINIPVKSIGESAFGKCKNLREIQINSASLERICKRAFMDSKKLKLLAIRTKKLTASRIGKDAVKGTGKKLKFLAPKRKYKQYLKVLRQRGNAGIRYGGN